MRGRSTSGGPASAWGARYEARELLKNHDVVVIDTPPKMGVDGRPAIEVCDLVLIPVTPSPVDLWATEPTLELATHEKRPALMVINRATRRARLTGEMQTAIAGLGGEVSQNMIGNRIVFAECMGIGAGVIERQSSGPAAAEIRAVAEEVAKRLG